MELKSLSHTDSAETGVVQLSQGGLDTCIARSSEGDAKAASVVLTELCVSGYRAQSQAALAVLDVSSVAFWEYVLEFVSLGIWAGNRVALPTSVRRRSLRLKLKALFQPPFIKLMCYHLDCKTRFRLYVELREFECPACRRRLKFNLEQRSDGLIHWVPNPAPDDLAYARCCWCDNQGRLILWEK